MDVAPPLKQLLLFFGEPPWMHMCWHDFIALFKAPQ